MIAQASGKINSWLFLLLKKALHATAISDLAFGVYAV
jgi:hypothetical protein